MPRFRKKPVEIEARRMPLRLEKATESEFRAMHQWVRGGGARAVCLSTGLRLPTLEGAMLAEWGDWVIQGIQGEFYPCKPDIFEQTYEAVEGES